MAARLVLAVAAEREMGLARKTRQELDEPRRLGPAHLAAIVALELRPALAGERLRERPAHDLLARRELGQPHVVVVEPRVILLLYAARRPPRRADAQALALLAGRPEAHYLDRK